MVGNSWFLIRQQQNNNNNNNDYLNKKNQFLD